MLMQVSNDIQAQYSGILGHMPQHSYQQFGHSGFMMPQDGTNNMWSLPPMSDTSVTEIPPYLGPKNQQMVSILLF